ncbi:putative hydrolase or acyltransferase of alpha/beta superfamily [Burkholderia sp. Ch1-1]|nr:putative hydrolase or acyltransferase of alpha/beta superfamily [Burkholderia sp. Ch1-1]
MNSPVIAEGFSVSRAAAVPPQQALVDVDGARIAVKELGPRGAETIVFLHGGGPGCNAWTDWAAVGVRLSGEFRCVFIDMAQYGGSSREPIAGKFFSTQSRYVLQVLDALEISSAHFVCQSLGSSVALRLAADRPEAVRSLAMTGATPLTYGVISPAAIMRVARTSLGAYYGGEGPTRAKMRQLLAECEWFDSSRIPDELVELRYQISVDPADLRITSDLSTRGELEDLSDALSAVQAPVLLAYGDSDPFAPPEIPLHLFTRLKNARLVIFKGASHHFPEEDPNAYLYTYRAWLDEVRQSPNKETAL